MTPQSKDPWRGLPKRRAWIIPAAEQTVQTAVADLIHRIGGQRLEDAPAWHLAARAAAHHPDRRPGRCIDTLAIAFDALGTVAGAEAFNAAADGTLALGLLGAIGAAT